ncbi:MAG: PD-(D/E)XK nuclease family protein [Neisseriaceae bacterium]|nr:MAG: PD-(D/E)XK nuclease family protein [Neisseriaceae bacterium]
MFNIIKIRASSLGELFDCPARWEAKHLLKMPRKTNVAAFLGTSVHAGTAKYDQSVLDNNKLSPMEAAGAIVDILKNPEEDIDWGDDTPKSIEKKAIPIHLRYCSNIAPKMEYVAVELTCQPLIFTDLRLELTGSTDRVYKDKLGNLGIADIKTGKTAVSSANVVATGKHAAQMGVYELLAEHSFNQQIDAPAQIIGLNTSNDKAAIGTLSGARELLLGDEFNKGLLHRASELIHSGNFYGNPSSMLCSEKYCPRHSVCKFKK